MPDDQFATDINPLGASYATATREAVVSQRIDHTAPPPVQLLPEGVGSPALVKRQERMIQQAYGELVAADHVEYASWSNVLYQASKRVLDFSVALLALTVLAPLMIAIAAAIRLDSPGPAIFKQNRVGRDGRLFCMYKFRSMAANAGVRLNGVHKSAEDDRVTRIGRFIRMTSLDELPQLINVLLGQMSLVGPRPELPEIVLQRYEPWQYRRLAVPQGITGWWQVTGRGKKLLWKHTDDDLYYVDHASFWFDLKLLVMTVLAVFRRDGAF